MISLNESQYKAALHRDGPMMVLAGPGSGKTAVITHRAVCLIEHHHIPAENILIITYTKAAAEEMRKRFSAITPDKLVTIGTFHSVFFRILRKSSGMKPEQVCKEHERRDMIKSLLSAMEYDLEDENLSAVCNELSLVKNELLELRYYHSSSISSRDFIKLFNQYESYKKKHDKIDFDDMLSYCHDLFIRDKKTLKTWQARYPYIMIDEFQDINHVQYEIIKMLAAALNNIFIVGDDDQSIYRFRGSRPEFLLHFPKDYPQARQVVLEINYRSTDSIIAFANALIANNRIRYGKTIAGTHKKGKAPVMLTANDQNHEAEQIAELIKKQYSKGADLDGIAVIYRLNLQARAFTDAFIYRNIPFKVRDEAPGIYEHWIAQDVTAYLRLSRNYPQGYDPDAWRIINKPYRFIGKAFLSAVKKANVHIFDAFKSNPALHTNQRNRIYELQYGLQTARKKDAVNAVRFIRQEIGYDQYIREHCEYRRIDPSGLYEIADELQEAAKPFKKIDDFLSHINEALRFAKESKEAQGPRVTLSTMHSAKGLEFDTVYITGAVDGVIPHERSKTDAEIEEERRLLYVAATRAKQMLYISAPTLRYEKPVKISRFLTVE
jgi:DNA helicase-2/ATP-dependent DNA helicase PcrA